MTQSPVRSRNLPFLHRNWLTAINFLQSATVGSKPDDAHSRSTDGHDDLRPSKRRRFANSPDSGIGQDIDSILLPDGQGEMQRAIRIEVLKITHQDVSRVRSNGVLNGTIPPAIKDVTSVNARCKITITTSSHTVGESRTLYCDSQMCTIKTFQNPVGSSQMARVYLPQPFHVPEEKIYVERDDDTVFDLADSYTVTVDLESAGDRNWPPLNLLNTSSDEDIFTMRSASRHWVLGAEIPKIFDRGRRSGLIRLRKGTGQDIRTDFVLDIDVRGTTALPERHVWMGREKVPLPSVAVIDQHEESLLLSNGYVNGQHVNGHITNGNLVEDDIEEVADGELTPSRSLRTRGTKNYNLKVLSAQAQGKEVRKRSRAADSKRAEADSILYHLPREAIPFREVLVDGLACCFCHASHRSLAQLRAHLDSHVKFKYDFGPVPGKTGAQIHVSCIAVDSGPLLRPRIYQLGKPTKTFDLDRYVDGDDSWVKSRLGPHNDDGPVIAPRKNTHTRMAQPRALQRTVSRRKEKKVLVPETKQPLFHPLSKARLEPGTEVRQPAVDDTWLIQKHRDIVQDFIDVDAEEKDYIKEWDAFIQKRHISSDAYISRAVVDFVNEKLHWLLESKSRTTEFGKHLTVLIARGLDDDTVRQIQSRLQEARTQKPQEKEKEKEKEKEPPAESPKEAQYRSSRGCAVCGRFVRGPQLLLCANEVNMSPR
ncbi:Polycomb protein suz12-B [Cytospora mali]|uniref:Polycomb protein suz12-B n=1 Tax=Cytospora mali TaxID=578113 RepID=A0A194V7P9_CYTMA|nr:Polycomb protein suz12-B [Valsa mali var. pyri (nom. inval.)]